MPKMNVFVINCTDFPNGGATSVHTKLFVGGLQKNGVNAFLLIPYGSHLANLTGNTKIIGHYANVPFCYMNKTTVLPKRSRFISMIWGMTRTATVILKKRNRLDAVILYNPDFIRFLPIIIISLFIKVPLFICAVEKMSIDSEYKGIKGYLRYVGAVFAEYLLPKLVNGYIVISTLLADYYKEKNTKLRILISPILVDPCQHIQDTQKYEQKYNAIFKRKKIILYSGGYDEKDGFQYILKAYEKIRSQRDDVMLIITGAPLPMDLINSIRENEKHIESNDYVNHLGFLERDELDYLIHRSDLLLVCRSNSAFANHGFPWKLGEYCMSKRPVIATKVGDLPLYFKDNESIYFAVSEDPESIYNKMDEVFNNYKESLRIGEKGYKIACEKFNYLIEMEKVARFIIQ
jgi:glycosyltransferase involved in cell wall biosynthesis